jgi:hypothetical protein
MMDVNDVYILFILRDGAIHSSMFGNIWGGENVHTFSYSLTSKENHSSFFLFLPFFIVKCRLDVMSAVYII